MYLSMEIPSEFGFDFSIGENTPIFNNGKTGSGFFVASGTRFR
jgi:hypothetical protein